MLYLIIPLILFIQMYFEVYESDVAIINEILLILILIILIRIYYLIKNKQKIISVNEQYRIIQYQNERNNEIKHDLQYFLSMIKRKSNQQKMTELLERTIEKINNQNINLYSTNKMLNSLLVEMKDTAKDYNQNLLIDINTSDVNITLNEYQEILKLFKILCQNNDKDNIKLSIRHNQKYTTIEFIIHSKDIINFENSHILIEKIQDYQSIIYILKS